MLENIEKLNKEIADVSDSLKDKESLENFRIKYLSRKGLLNDLFEDFKNVDKSQKGAVGKALNDLKIYAQKIYDENQAELEKSKVRKNSGEDYTLPGRKFNLGSKHLITQALEDISNIFQRIAVRIAFEFAISFYFQFAGVRKQLFVFELHFFTVTQIKYFALALAGQYYVAGIPGKFVMPGVVVAFGGN